MIRSAFPFMAAGTHFRLAVATIASVLLHAAVLAGFFLLLPFAGGGPANGRFPRLTVVLAESRDVRPEAVDVPAPPAAMPETPPAAEVAPPAAIPLPGPRFHALSELDLPPVVIEDIPGNPPELASYPQGGKLLMRLWIDADGRVVDAEALSSDLPEPFVRSARENFLRAVFTPARKDGVAVASRIKIEMTFRPALDPTLSRGAPTAAAPASSAPSLR